MSWATPADIRTRWPGAPADDGLLQAWIDDAETVIRVEYPWVDDWLYADPDFALVLRLVVTRMVIRTLSAPAGVTREQVGDTAVSYAASSGLGLTDEDRALLDGYGPQTAYAIDTMPPRWWAS